MQESLTWVKKAQMLTIFSTFIPSYDYRSVMNTAFSTEEFYMELELSLATSTGDDRKKWAEIIIREDLDPSELTGLLEMRSRTAMRFLWLLSEVGILSPEKLFRHLSDLFEVCVRIDVRYTTSFASFWMYAGVPEKMEGKAIDLLFELFLSNETTVTIKSRALIVLARLAQKHPQLKHELCSCIEQQMDQYSKDFQKRSAGILRELSYLHG